MIHKKYLRFMLYMQFGLICLVLWGNTIAGAIEPPKNPNSAKGCAICHYRWIDTFFVEGKGTDLVPYQSEKVAADPEMCISCHDGSVMDSRDRVLHGKEHKTGVKPPAEMDIPEIFPLDEDGEVECATCHTAHGVESGPDVEETIFLRVSNTDSAMCKMCHPGKDGGPERGNHSLAASKKQIPQTLKMRWAHEGSQKNQVICETCHTAHGSTSEKYLVKGAGDSGLCLECHAEMGMFTPEGKRNTNHVINVAPRDVSIPAQLTEKGATLGYDGVITCQTCHKIHNNPIRQPVLLIAENDKSRFCLTCHADKKRVEKTNHHLGVSAKEETNLAGDTVAEAGVCSACHLPHRAARTPYAKNGDTDRTTALCLSCHAMGKVAENEMLSGYTHPVGMSMSAAEKTKTNPNPAMDLEHEMLDLPLYSKLGVADEAGQVTCATCHDAHGGPVIENAPPLEMDAPRIESNLLRKTSPDICRSCHWDKFGIESSRHDMKSVFPEGNPILEEKAPESDLCRNCHFIHTPEPDGFKWDELTLTETGDRVYNTCLNCHHKDGLASEMVIGDKNHPLNIPLTEGVRTPAELPLFNASGQKTQNGIMTCNTCHDPHRWSPVGTANGDYVAHDGRPVNRFLRIDAAPLSGLCIRCHEDQVAVRKTDHNLLETAPDSENALGLKPFESGVCGACHLVHDNTMKAKLWARDLGDGDNVMDRMCNSCHTENGAASKKVPEIATHPETIFIDKLKISQSADLKEAFPLFDKTTAKRVKTGNISCPSCHNAHRWSVNAPTDDRANTEGYATTSFLRQHIHDRVCRDCHGIESLYKYKYFHDPEKRKR